MPGLSSERQPNNAITGPELLVLTLSLIEKELRKEWVFNQGTAYPRVGIEATVKYHFVSPSLPKVEVHVRPQVPLEAAPLRDIGTADSGVIALKIEKTIENPNLERVHAGIPIQVVSKVNPAPGEMFPRIETHAVVYDKADYPEPDPAKVTDLSEATAKEWNVNAPDVVHIPAVPGVDRKRGLIPKHLRSNPVDEIPLPPVPQTVEDELNAVSTEEPE